MGTVNEDADLLLNDIEGAGAVGIVSLARVGKAMRAAGIARLTVGRVHVELGPAPVSTEAEPPKSAGPEKQAPKRRDDGLTEEQAELLYASAPQE